jgi:hypothetical protein
MENSLGFYTAIILHYCVGIFNMTYPYIFDKKWDAYFLFYIVLLYLHWHVFGECIISYFEKLFYYGKDNYSRGKDDEHHLFIKHIFGKFGEKIPANLIFMIITILSVYALFIVLLRSKWVPRIIAYLMMAFAFIYNTYFVIKKFNKK